MDIPMDRCVNEVDILLLFSFSFEVVSDTFLGDTFFGGVVNCLVLSNVWDNPDKAISCVRARSKNVGSNLA